jgi:hypothetical protein
MNKMTQRNTMRVAYIITNGVREACINEYARAERFGFVLRASNMLHLSAEDYAARLYADGIQKGWLTH